MPKDKNIILKSGAIHTPESDKRPATVTLTVCDPIVPPAADSIIGKCEYYYRPLHKEYVKKSGVSTLEAIKYWATPWNPWKDSDVNERLIRNRDQLIVAKSESPDWSRHANFMMRHIGCEHLPPEYYVSYGYYYCSTYGKRLRPKLSPIGQKWLDDGRALLQKNMEKGLYDNMIGSVISIPCRRYPNKSVTFIAEQLTLEVKNNLFKRFAFDTHVPAYLDAGLADLPPSDLIKIGGQPNIEEWADGATWKQATSSGWEVAKDKTGSGIESTKNLVGSTLKRLISILK